MKRIKTSYKFKGLINGKDWESGDLKFYNNDLTAICREDTEFFVFKDSVSRFTGFCNSSGEEIYEGDLLASRDTNSEGIPVHLVFWDRNSREWKVGSLPVEDPLLSNPLDNCVDQVIVGHVFTHQYLLSSSKVDHFKTSG